jgi:hypothetical protein
MKRLSATLILLLLFGLAIIPAVMGQSLPASMAYSSSALILDAPAETGQKLLIAGNNLAHEQRSVFDLSRIPAAPDSVVRNSKIASSTMTIDGNTVAELGASTSKVRRSALLLGVLAIAYLATRKRENPRMKSDISELRNFPKKRLARKEAHA